jgi:hypothetical protein
MPGILVTYHRIIKRHQCIVFDLRRINSYVDPLRTRGSKLTEIQEKYSGRPGVFFCVFLSLVEKK